MRFVLATTLTIFSITALAAERPSIIDMHIHSYGEVAEYGVYGSIGPHGRKGPDNQKLHFQDTYERFRKYNITKAVVSGSPASVETWKNWDEDDRIIRGLMIDLPSDYGLSVQRFEEMVKNGKVEIFGELGPYYSGTTLAAPLWDPFLVICEQYDIPVAVHTGGGGPGETYSRHPNARLILADPFLIEDVLVKYPRLRVYLMHAGEHEHEHALRLMAYYPQVYADISALLWVTTQTQRYAREFLHNAKQAGLLDRVMFGSDQMRWPDTIDMSIEYLNSLDFLNEQDKRDILYNNAARFLRLEE
jgi:uncharacterized protein